MQRRPDSERRLDAVVSVNGKIVAWRCTACRWSVLAEDAHGGATEKTKLAFDRHNCMEHPETSASGFP